MRSLAWHACIIANVWLPKNKRLKVEDLIGEPGEAPPAFLNKESLREYMRERVAKAKAEAKASGGGRG